MKTMMALGALAVLALLAMPAASASSVDFETTIVSENGPGPCSVVECAVTAVIYTCNYVTYVVDHGSCYP